MSDWHKNTGTPVEPEINVEVCFRDGYTSSGHANLFYWDITGDDEDILYWRYLYNKDKYLDTDYQTVQELIEHLREHAYWTAGGGTSEPNFDPETLVLEFEAAKWLEFAENWFRQHGMSEESN